MIQSELIESFVMVIPDHHIEKFDNVSDDEEYVIDNCCCLVIDEVSTYYQTQV